MTISRPEQALQRAVTSAFRYILPPQVFWTAINPVPGKTMAAAGLSKAMGMRAGVPDLLVVHAGRAFFIELKAGSSVSRAQKDCAHLLALASAPRCLARSLEEVVAFFDHHGIPHSMRASV